jgi:hypothetical protein
MAYSTDLDTVNTPFLYVVRDQAYFTNDYDPIKAIRPQQGTDFDAGLTGPSGAMGSPITSSGGACTAGRHFLRYRYRDSRTGYVSNPSDALDITITDSTDKLVFPVSSPVSSTTAVLISTDARVNQIVIEMTQLESAEYYVAGTITNTSQDATISLNDATLLAQTAVSLNWGGTNDEDSFSHNSPPLAAFGCEHKGRHFVGGKIDREYQCDVLTSCSVVTIGTSQAFASGWGSRFLWFPDSDLVYDIDSIDSDTQLTLKSNWTASSDTVTGVVTAMEPNMVYWSLPLYMESFDTTRFARRVLEGRADILKGMISYRGDIIFFGGASAEVLSYRTNPGVPDGYTTPIPGHRGVHNARCVTEALGVLYMFDRRGLWTLAGKTVDHISDPVEDIVDLDIDYDYDHLFHVAFCPVTNHVLCFYVKSGDTTTQWALAYDTIRKKWMQYEFQQAITATTVVKKPNGDVILVLLDANGYSWEYGARNTVDGVSLDNALATVNSGSTVSNIEVNEDISALDLVGVYAYFPTDDETCRIVSNQANSILISSSLGGAPSAGEYVYFGVAPVTYEFKWEIGDGTVTKKKPAYFNIEQIPASGGKGRVYFYADGSSTASTFSRNLADTAPDDILVVDGRSYAEFPLDQDCASIPVPVDFERSIKAKIYSVRPEGEMRLLSAYFAPMEEVPYAGE